MRKLFFALSYMVCLCTFAQNRGRIWFLGTDTCVLPPTSCQPSVYGNASGLDFNMPVPIPIAACSIAPDDIYSVVESIATMADKTSGSLLFYSEGLNVWDRNHNLMPNGTGLIGSTAVSATQGALIIPFPGSDSLYYLFTTGSDVDNFTNGLRYSVIDMSLNSGMGDIVIGQKNILLHPSVTEKLTAAVHCNGTDVWIIAHEIGSNNYLAFLVTPSGINPPVITGIGSVIAGSSDGARGQMKASPNGYKLASALNASTIGASKFEWFDFNPSTGELCNFMQLTGLTFTYGVSFSPDNSKLYFTEYFLSNNVNQLDLNAGGGHPDSVKASKTIVGNGIFIAALQLAHDGKIYGSQITWDSLAVINNPNLPGLTCNFSVKGSALAPEKICSFGLPNFLDNYFLDSSYVLPTAQANFGFNNLCLGDTVSFKDSSAYYSNCPNFKWTFGDALSGLVDTSYFQNPQHIYSLPGTYIVTLIIYDYCDIDTIQKQVTILNPLADAGPDTAICKGNIVILNGSGGTSFLWSNGATASSIGVSPSVSTTYSLNVWNGNCSDTDSVRVIVNLLPSVDAGNNISVIIGQSGQLSASGSGSYSWIPSTGLSCYTCSNPIVTVQSTTTYYLQVTDTNGCVSIDSVTIFVEFGCSDLFIPNAFSPNGDGQNDVFKIEAGCIEDLFLEIYNRWGEKLFESSNITEGWNGHFKEKEMGTGIYIYHFMASLKNGIGIFKTGNLSLIR